MKAEVATSSYLVKMKGTHLETIKDGGTVFGQFKIIGHFQTAILDFRDGNQFILNPHVSKM